MRAVAASLNGVAVSLKVIELPGLPEKGDISDWLDQGHTKEELLQLVEQASDISSGPNDTADSPNTVHESSRSEALAKRIAELVLASGAELFHDEREEPYARVNTQHGKKLMPIGSRAFRRVLSYVAWK